MGKRNL
jgi:hypothetical protein